MKLGNLLKKELKELITLQSLVSMIFSCLLLVVMGKVMGTAMDEAINNTTVNIANLDNSEFTAQMIEKLPDYGADPNIVTISDEENFYNDLVSLGLDNLVIIPDGFGESVMNGNEPSPVKCVSLINKTGLSSTMTEISASELTNSIASYVYDYLRTDRFNLTDVEQKLISDPILRVEYTSANGRTVEMPSSALNAMIMTQSFIAPFAVFFLILMASQMIMTAISTEKIDKTLETLLSAPVSRITVLTAKMIAAVIVALLNAAFMMVGFVFYIQGMTGSIVESETAALQMNMGSTSMEMGDVFSMATAMANLGFSLSTTDIILFGIQLFLTVAIGLSISLILGAMATDVKSVQTLVLPIMMATMVPFFATMFADVNSLPLVPKLIMYVIPFTHTYTAMGNLMFGNTALFWGGLVYQLVFFAVCMYLAVKMFTTDSLFTMNFNVDSFSNKNKKGLFAKKTK